MVQSLGQERGVGSRPHAVPLMGLRVLLLALNPRAGFCL